MSSYRGTGFTQTLHNEAKEGYYPTEIQHCIDMGKALLMPEGQEVCVLEPSMGDGSAVTALTGAAGNPDIRIFGVEINRERAEMARKNPLISDVLCADFTDGVTIRNRAFSLIFGNPPYMDERTETGGKVRLEKVFLEKVLNYLKTGGVLVWVIPYSSFADTGTLRLWNSELDTLALYRFRGREYERFHQVVIYGRKRAKRPVSVEFLTQYREKWLSNIEELPSSLEPTIEVYPSPESGVDLFTTREFNSDLAYSILDAGLTEEMRDRFSEGVSQKRYDGGALSRPPVPLKKDSKYLLVTSGFTDGIVGTEEDGDIHLMRGVANVVEHICYNTGSEEDQETNTATVRTSTEVELRILENDGTLTIL